MKKKILISCNMEIQHFYFVKSFIDEYKDIFDIKIIFQSHLKDISFFKRLKIYIKRRGFLALFRRLLCSNEYSKIFNEEKIAFYNKFYPKITLEDLYKLIGKENIIIAKDINAIDMVKEVSKFSPNLFLLQGGKLLKNKFLQALENSYVLHLHLGLVPYYRGGNSQFWSIYNNQINENGFTIQSVDLGIDTGSIYIRKSIIDFDKIDTQHSMFCKTHMAGINAIKDLIDFYKENNYIPKAITNNLHGKNYTGKMMTPSVYEYVYLNRERIFNNYDKSNKILVYKDISVI